MYNHAPIKKASTDMQAITKACTIVVFVFIIHLLIYIYMIIYDSRLDEMITPTKNPSRLGIVVKIANEVSKETSTHVIHTAVWSRRCETAVSSTTGAV